MNSEDSNITTELHSMNYVFQHQNANPGGILSIGRIVTKPKGTSEKYL